MPLALFFKINTYKQTTASILTLVWVHHSPGYAVEFSHYRKYNF